MTDENVFLSEPAGPAEPAEANFATVGTIYSDGVTLIFDGESEASAKHYKVNAFVVFKAGNRVRLIKDSGTYVVEYPVGNPKTSFKADSATTATTATSATTATTASNALKLNNKAEASLDVSSADSADTATNSTSVIDQYNTARTLQFRMSAAGSLQVKSNYWNSGNWKTITYDA